MSRLFGPPLEIRLLVVGVAALGVAGGVISLVAAPSSRTTGVPLVVVGVLLAGLSALLGVRGWRLGVVLSGDRAVVRGILWSRTIPRAAITEVRDQGFVGWRDEAGRPRETPVTGLMFQDAPSGPNHDRRRNAMQLVRGWSESGRVPPPTRL